MAWCHYTPPAVKPHNLLHHVPALAPDTASQFVTAELDVSPQSVSAHPLTVAFFAMTKDAQGNFTGARRITAPNEVKPSETVTSFRLRRASGNPWKTVEARVQGQDPASRVELIDAL